MTWFRKTCNRFPNMGQASEPKSVLAGAGNLLDHLDFKTFAVPGVTSRSRCVVTFGKAA